MGGMRIPRHIDERRIKKAVEKMHESRGQKLIKSIFIKGRILEAEIAVAPPLNPCDQGVLDDLITTLEELDAPPYAICDCQSPGPGITFLVRLVKLDFLHEIRRAMEEVGELVHRRMEEFKRIRNDEDSLFSELCFCLLTANFTALGGMRIQNAIGMGFLTLEEHELVDRLRKLGHRFPEARAKYIVEARWLHGKLREILSSFETGAEVRNWLAQNVKGLGYKEASHFLRNVGFSDISIIDRHVLRFLKDHDLIDEIPKSLAPNAYIRLEKILRAIAGGLGITPGELDLYIWRNSTGRVLK